MRTEFVYDKKNIVINHHDDHIGKCIRKDNNFYENKLLSHIKNNIKGGLFVDVGANIGNHTCFFSLFCATRVIAIEPVKENYELLLKNIEINNIKNVIPINKVLALTNKKYTYKIIPENMGMCDMSEDIDGIDSITPEELPLEDLRLLKIDCEKMSQEVFKSFTPTILKSKCDIIIEATDFEIQNMLKLIPYKIIGRFNATPTYHLKHK